MLVIPVECLYQSNHNEIIAFNICWLRKLPWIYNGWRFFFNCLFSHSRTFDMVRRFKWLSPLDRRSQAERDSFETISMIEHVLLFINECQDTLGICSLVFCLGVYCHYHMHVDDLNNISLVLALLMTRNWLLHLATRRHRRSSIINSVFK